MKKLLLGLLVSISLSLIGCVNKTNIYDPYKPKEITYEDVFHQDNVDMLLGKRDIIDEHFFSQDCSKGKMGAEIHRNLYYEYFLFGTYELSFKRDGLSVNLHSDDKYTYNDNITFKYVFLYRALSNKGRGAWSLDIFRGNYNWKTNTYTSEHLRTSNDQYGYTKYISDAAGTYYSWSKFFEGPYNDTGKTDFDMKTLMLEYNNGYHSNTFWSHWSSQQDIKNHINGICILDTSLITTSELK